MILNNYWNWRAYMSSHTCLSGLQSSGNYFYIGTKSLDGSNMSVYISTYCTGSQKNWSMTDLTSYIGSGSTTPTVDDYAMEDDRTSSFTNVQRSFNIAADDNKVSIIHTITGTNATNSDITISEIGIVQPLYCYPSNSLVYTMFIHDILEQPIVVPPGRSFSLTFEWVES